MPHDNVSGENGDQTQTRRSQSPSQSGAQSDVPQFDTEFATKCNTILEDFRGGRLTFTASFIKLQTLVAAKTSDEQEQEKALSSYLYLLQTFNRLREETGVRGDGESFAGHH